MECPIYKLQQNCKWDFNGTRTDYLLNTSTTESLKTKNPLCFQRQHTSTLNISNPTKSSTQISQNKTKGLCMIASPLIFRCLASDTIFKKRVMQNDLRKYSIIWNGATFSAKCPHPIVSICICGVIIIHIIYVSTFFIFLSFTGDHNLD